MKSKKNARNANNDDFDFISSKFKEDNINAPESLSAKNMIEKIENEKNPKIIKVGKKSRAAKTALSLVACIAVFVAGFGLGTRGTGLVYETKRAKEESAASYSVSRVAADGVDYFKSYDELGKTLKKIQKENNSSLGDAETLKSSGVSGDTAAAEGGTQSFASTNIQVDGVDEADIIKNDGRYIYYIPGSETGDNTKINIFSAKNGKAELLSQIKLKSEGDEYFKEMYLSGDRLIAIGYSYSDGDKTFVNIYDISNRKNPVLKSEYSQSGYCLDSRFFNDTVYVISNYYAYDYKDIPLVECPGSKAQRVPVENICAVDGCSNTGFAVIGAVSLDGKADKKNTKAVLGAGDNVYCSKSNLYLAGTSYGEALDGKLKNSAKTTTRLVKYSLDGLKIKLEASASLDGETNDQFSIDEKDGMLRIATTVYNYSDDKKNKNYLFVLDEKLKKTGSVSGFARGEHIEAVRFINDTAYVITYETTDPLFVIDLSNPKSPEIRGEVKIDGFSSNLTPVDENTLLGIGYSTKKSEYGIERNGLKFVLFDISDAEKPKVLSEKTITDAFSPAQEDHKAICINRDGGYFAVPVEAYDDKSNDYNGRIETVFVKDKKLEIKEYDCKKNDPGRCVYIGNYLYALLNEGDGIISFEIKQQ